MSEIGLIGKKIGMTREFFKTGKSVPVTVIAIPAFGAATAALKFAVFVPPLAINAAVSDKPDDKVIVPPSLLTPPPVRALASLLALTVVILKYAAADPLAEKSHANEGAASATEATAASIILLNCFITLLEIVMRLVCNPNHLDANSILRLL